MAGTKGNTAFLRVVNRESVIKLLLETSPLTKQDIARVTSLSFSAVSNLVSEMEEDKTVREVGLAASGGGRKATLYELNPHACVFLGVDIQVERLSMVIMGQDASVIASHEESLDVTLGPTAVVKRIVELARSLVSRQGFKLQDVGGMGVSVPGPIDARRQIVVSPPNLPGWRNVPLGDMIESAIGITCLIEKDANAAAFGECKYGAGRGVDNLLYVMADTGIGGAIIINGSIFRGSFDDAGDIGHMPIDINGPKCNCGRTGCVEALASGLAIERKIQLNTGTIASISDLYDLYEIDEEMACIVREAGRYLGCAVGGLVNALNTSLVIFGGSLLGRSEHYFQETVESMKRQVLPEFVHQVRVERPRFREFAGAVGAAALMVHRKLLSHEEGLRLA